MKQTRFILESTENGIKGKTLELQGEEFTVVNVLILLFSKVCELGMYEQVIEDLENQYDGEGYYIYHDEFIKDLEDKYPTYKESLLDGVDDAEKENILFLARSVAELIKLDPDHEFYNDQSDIGNNGDMGYFFDIKFTDKNSYLFFTSELHKIKFEGSLVSS